MASILWRAWHFGYGVLAVHFVLTAVLAAAMHLHDAIVSDGRGVTSPLPAKCECCILGYRQSESDFVVITPPLPYTPPRKHRNYAMEPLEQSSPVGQLKSIICSFSALKQHERLFLPRIHVGKKLVNSSHDFRRLLGTMHAEEDTDSAQHIFSCLARPCHLRDAAGAIADWLNYSVPHMNSCKCSSPRPTATPDPDYGPISCAYFLHGTGRWLRGSRLLKNLESILSDLSPTLSRVTIACVRYREDPAEF
ncbi:hypothetical protein BKA67DRAFT_413392 [Truncatella angustata]|uniref:Uncharacterized protein n=1 Tax=Truncatella angustata TaxID=152316 RepID=A0A9P8RIJ4_9PEZI|nr:uncharacterized protein BKA67DRAFT_413392 [Truncatella angustata]KAH6646688.1 hypothetical protein BKA67DRAFT_413392 [Truncatella angustata]